MLSNRNHSRTTFVRLDTAKCRACWKCIEKCPNKVIGKINLPWHKHARIIRGDTCSGCLRCVKLCQYEAFSAI